MKYLIMFLQVLCLYQTNAQEVINKKHNFAILKNKPVKIELEGEIVITSWQKENAEINIETKATGDVWGIHSGKDDYKKYDVIINEFDDQIIISPNENSGAFVIGVSTLDIKHRHVINLPENTKLFLKSDEADMTIRGKFKAVDINFDDGSCRLELNKNEFKLLECGTDNGRIYFDNENQGASLKMFANGNSIYSVFTDEGRIEVDIEG